jgi:hypothetical protein
MDPSALTLAAFQKHIKDRYESVDRARGTPKTWMWFIEEVGELSHALAKADDRPTSKKNSPTSSPGSAPWPTSTTSI